MKLQSKAYVKSAQQQGDRLRALKLGKVDSSALRADAEFQVGNFEHETESIKVSVQNSAEVANKFRIAQGLGESDTAVVIVLECLPEATKDTFDLLEPIFSEIASGAGATVSINFDESTKTLTGKATVPPEIAGLGLGVLETANLSLFEVQVLGDQKNAAFKTTVQAALSRNIIELGHEMGAIPDELVKVIDMYLSSKVRIHLRSPQLIEHPLVKQGFQMATSDRSQVAPLAKKFFKELPDEAKAFYPTVMQISTIKSANFVIGNSLFSAGFNLPGLVQLVKFDPEEKEEGSGSGSD